MKAQTYIAGLAELAVILTGSAYKMYTYTQHIFVIKVLNNARNICILAALALCLF